MVRLEKRSVGESDALAARAFAWGRVQNIRNLATAVGVDESGIWLVNKYRSISSDLENNVLLAAAQRSGADYVVSWDAGVLRAPVVRTADPVQMLTLLRG